MVGPTQLRKLHAARLDAVGGLLFRVLPEQARHRHLQFLERAEQLQRAPAQVAEAVKRGVLAAGGFPLEFPTISLGEMFMKPTTMLFRNLMAMDVEESIRANPLDGVVLLCGCDKTTPAQLMGAASADIPAIMVPGGPMLSGQWRDRMLGSGTDGRKLFDLFRTGPADRRGVVRDRRRHFAQRRALHRDGHRFDDDQPRRSAGHDTARLRQHPGARFAPLTIAEMSGRRIVEMVLRRPAALAAS